MADILASTSVLPYREAAGQPGSPSDQSKHWQLGHITERHCSAKGSKWSVGLVVCQGFMHGLCWSFSRLQPAWNFR